MQILCCFFALRFPWSQKNTGFLPCSLTRNWSGPWPLSFSTMVTSPWSSAEAAGATATEPMAAMPATARVRAKHRAVRAISVYMSSP